MKKPDEKSAERTKTADPEVRKLARDFVKKMEGAGMTREEMLEFIRNINPKEE